MNAPAGGPCAACDTHLVLIPSFNSGGLLRRSVNDALRHWPHVWVVIDGSSDGSDASLADLRDEPGLHIIRRQRNGGKGAAVRDGIRQAAPRGFTHVLVMDGDGQHPAASIAEFMAVSKENPRAMILGAPRFDASAPRLRVLCRRLSNVLTRLESSRDVADSLFGFRVYPLAQLLRIMQASRHMNGFDFDPEAVVRLGWAGVPAINLEAPVRYFRKSQGGTSHFRYGRDNARLALMHLRLLTTQAGNLLTSRQRLSRSFLRRFFSKKRPLA